MGVVVVEMPRPGVGPGHWITTLNHWTLEESRELDLVEGATPLSHSPTGRSPQNNHSTNKRHGRNRSNTKNKNTKKSE